MKIYDETDLEYVMKITENKHLTSSNITKKE